jgi:hypothetical protein
MQPVFRCALSRGTFGERQIRLILHAPRQPIGQSPFICYRGRKGDPRH